MDLGICEEHQRPNEAYDNELCVMVCPDCAMFGKSVGHKLTKPGTAVTDIRDEFDKSIKDGFLKSDHTEWVLVDIREALNICDQTKNKVLKEADKLMKELISEMYQRKEAVLNEISEYFQAQRSVVEAHEQNWVDKQQTAEELLRLSQIKESEDQILWQSDYIAQGLSKISTKPHFELMEMVASLDSVMHVNDDETGVLLADVTHEKMKR